MDSVLEFLMRGERRREGISGFGIQEIGISAIETGASGICGANL